MLIILDGSTNNYNDHTENYEILDIINYQQQISLLTLLLKRGLLISYNTNKKEFYVVGIQLLLELYSSKTLIVKIDNSPEVSPWSSRLAFI